MTDHCDGNLFYFIDLQHIIRTINIVTYTKKQKILSQIVTYLTKMLFIYIDLARMKQVSCSTLIHKQMESRKLYYENAFTMLIVFLSIEECESFHEYKGRYLSSHTRTTVYQQTLESCKKLCAEDNTCT